MSPPPAEPGDGGPPETVRIYPSRLKHLMLTVPCALLALAGLRALEEGAGSLASALALIVFGAAGCAVLAAMGFSRAPVLIFDADGIRCRRPALGLVPWRAIVGLAIARAALARSVLVIAYDEAELDDEARARLSRERPSALNRPRLSRQLGEVARRPTVQVPLSMLAVSPRRLRRLLEQEVQYRRVD